MGPMGWTRTVVDHQALAPFLGQVGMARLDRAARVSKGQGGAAIDCPPRKRVSFFSPPPLALSAATISRAAATSGTGRARGLWVAALGRKGKPTPSAGNVLRPTLQATSGQRP